MKTLALILSFYIGLLNVQPSLSMVYYSLNSAKDNGATHSCCKQKKMNNCKEEKKSHSNNCCNDGVCNPFALCSCCFGYTHSESKFTFSTFVSISKFISFKDINEVSNYASSCFHPPEMI